VGRGSGHDKPQGGEANEDAGGVPAEETVSSQPLHHRWTVLNWLLPSRGRESTPPRSAVSRESLLQYGTAIVGQLDEDPEVRREVEAFNQRVSNKGEAAP
jgi:hypothetical protein